MCSSDSLQPMVRAASACDYLAFLDHEEPGVQGQVRALLPPEVEHRFARSRFMRGLVKATGLTAKGILRQIPKSIHHFYRNVCEVEVIAQEHGCAQIIEIDQEERSVLYQLTWINELGLIDPNGLTLSRSATTG